MRTQRFSVLLIGAFLVLVTGCNNPDANGSTTPSDSASASDSAAPDTSAPDSSSDQSGSATNGTGSGPTTTVTAPPTTVTAPPAAGRAPTTGTPPSNARTAPGGPVHHYRPMTAAEKQTYQHCRQQPHEHECAGYTDDALRRRGIDPTG